jgi:leucyl/phenylalanyl-tRNA--protein transferase
MTVYRLNRELAFPPPDDADASGLLAIGGDLSPERLLLAYSLGIFPWYEEDQPILWHAPDPRTVLVPSRLHVARRLDRQLRGGTFDVCLDTAFERVIRACATVPRRDQHGTWITPDMIEAYCRLFDLGFAHCAETWSGGELVGGIYGVSLGGCFFGESMFSHHSNASKVAFVTLVRQLERWDFDLVDCQIPSEHLASFGAVDWSRPRFAAELEQSLRRPTRRGRWRLERSEKELEAS